jgi:hypothetical protein
MNRSRGGHPSTTPKDAAARLQCPTTKPRWLSPSSLATYRPAHMGAETTRSLSSRSEHPFAAGHAARARRSSESAPAMLRSGAASAYARSADTCSSDAELRKSTTRDLICAPDKPSHPARKHLGLSLHLRDARTRPYCYGVSALRRTMRLTAVSLRSGSVSARHPARLRPFPLDPPWSGGRESLKSMVPFEYEVTRSVA